MGCVLYVATLGLRPFGNGAGALRKILRNEYKAPTALRPDYPVGLEAIIIKALSPTPEGRFTTAEDMQLALEEWLVSTGRLVTASDVARCMRERVNVEVRARNDALLSQTRVASDVLMSRLSRDGENETPTAGSGLTQAPAALWRGKPMLVTSPPPETDPSPSDAELTRLRVAPAPAVQRQQAVMPRPSDATALVDFVPVGAQGQAPTTPPETEPESTPEFRSGRSPARLLLLALLVALATFALSRLFNR
jgi:serine/threonine protein kinase